MRGAGRQQGVGDRPHPLPGATIILRRGLDEEEEQGREKHFLALNELVGKIVLLYRAFAK